MFITNPGVQKPHCEPFSLAMRYCTGLNSLRQLPVPSVVVISMPSNEQRGRRQELIDRCSTRSLRSSQRDNITVHAPHPPCAQLFFVPVKPTLGERSQSTSRTVGSTFSKTISCPFRTKRRSAANCPGGAADIGGPFRC